MTIYIDWNSAYEDALSAYKQKQTYKQCIKKNDYKVEIKLVIMRWVLTSLLKVSKDVLIPDVFW